jgi:hypothetical protein
MAKMKLTAAAVASLPAPDPSGKQLLHWDTDSWFSATLLAARGA